MGNWQNFLKNLGEWEGSFSQINPDGEMVQSVPSLLSLEEGTTADQEQRVIFRLRRFKEGRDRPATQDYTQEYTTIGRQNVFFETGAFSKGSLQLAPFSEFGAEYGFIDGDRRARLVQLFNKDFEFSSLTLIREFRVGTVAHERPHLTVDQLLGRWQGEATTYYSDWRSPDIQSTALRIDPLPNGVIQYQLSFGDRTFSAQACIQNQGLCLWFENGATPRKMLLLADGVSSSTPTQLMLRQPFFVEAGWLLSDHQRQRIIRQYSDRGEWISSTFVHEHRVC